MEKNVTASRIFNASVEDVWSLWTKPELVMQWWGPDKFILLFPGELNYKEESQIFCSLYVYNI